MIERMAISGKHAPVARSGRQDLFPAGTAIAGSIGYGGNMATCEVCNNEYDKTFEISMAGTTHTFDSFECAFTH
jgi:hypothetical protein